MELLKIPIPQNEKIEPIWRHPESALFLEWYLDQSSKLPEDRSAGYLQFLEEVEKGTASLPRLEPLSPDENQGLE